MAIQKFTIAVDRRKREDGADFLNCTWFGKGAEATASYMTKGLLVSVSGRLQTGNYVNKEGVKIYTTDIIVDDVQFLGGKNSSNDTMEKSSRHQNIVEETDEIGDEVIPF